MSEGQYKAIGWGIFAASVMLALYWSLNATGLTGFLISLSEKLTGQQLTQICWLLTGAAICLPGWMAKNYFEGLAWNAHVKNLPPPDIRESARKSKYVRTDNLPPAPPKPIQLDKLAEGQEEFIATCPACGNFFPAKKGSGPIKCASCGEPIPVN